MNIHEYQAKSVLRAFVAPIANGTPAFTPEDAVEAAQKLGGPLWVVKSADPRWRARQGQVQGGFGRREGRRAACPLD